MKTILIISYSDLNSDPRVLRQIDLFKKNFKIITAGLNEGSNSHFRLNSLWIDRKIFTGHYNLPVLLRKTISLFLRVSRLLFIPESIKSDFYLYFRFYEHFYWNKYKKNDLKSMLDYDFDIIIANDIITLPLACKLAKRKNSKVILDAHEYTPKEFENRPQWNLLWFPFYKYICENYIKETTDRFTVSSKIAEEYEKISKKKFKLALNAPNYQTLKINVVDLKKIKFVHHGVCSPVRELEKYIETFKLLSNQYELNFLITKSDMVYYKHLLEISKNSKNIIFHEPVPTKKISKYINQFDMSLIFIPPVNFNYVNCLPNKFFESIQARLGILSGPSFEMKKYIKKYNLGKISKDFSVESMVESIKSLKSKDIIMYKKQVNKYASMFSSENCLSDFKESVLFDDLKI